MPRAPRIAPGGQIYHVLNRAVGRRAFFRKDDDYEAFEQIFDEALERHPIRVLAFTFMPNHWHMVLWPEEDGQLTAFLRWVTLTHAMRWHAQRRSAGGGHLYQGRYKSFPIEEGPPLLHVLRYVERNALRSKLVSSAEEWPRSSLWLRKSRDARSGRWLTPWPVPRPNDWLKRVNAPQPPAELSAVRRSVVRGTPYGSPEWQRQIAAELGLESTLRPRGRPRKVLEDEG